MIYGTCLCGAIAFEAEEFPGLVFNCHCSRCRKSHGAAYATQVIAKRNSLKLYKGNALLCEYESTGSIRTFCSICGSRLMNYGKNDIDYLSVAISAIHNRSDFRPIGECYVGEKLFFTALDNSIPHFEALPELKDPANAHDQRG
jgi:hypothetical protein